MLLAFKRAMDFSPWASLLKMKLLVGHGGILVALFTCNDCIETFLLMSWLILSFNTVLAAPIEQDMRASGQVCCATTSMLLLL